MRAPTSKVHSVWRLRKIRPLTNFFLTVQKICSSFGIPGSSDQTKVLIVSSGFFLFQIQK
jgi:hypothetical protein